MPDGTLVGERGELRATIEIKRGDTGKVEYYDMVGFVNAADLEALLADQSKGLNISGEATLTHEAAPEDLLDHTAAVDQDAVTSTVKVKGVVTERTYSDGTVQRNIWENEDEAKAFAASVNAQEGAE